MTSVERAQLRSVVAQVLGLPQRDDIGAIVILVETLAPDDVRVNIMTMGLNREVVPAIVHHALGTVCEGPTHTGILADELAKSKA